MPVRIKDHQDTLYQRNQYAKGGIGRLYWDYRDRAILPYIGEHDEHIADIGCGEGITLEHLNRIFPEKYFLGIDPLRENLTICARHNLKITGGDVYNLPVRNCSFDCVLLLEVIEHLLSPDPAVSEIQRILKPKGKLILIFPNDKIFRLARIMTGKIKEAFYNPGHLKQWTPGDMRRLLNRNGFEILKQKSIPFFLWHVSLHHMVVCEKAV
ncbi:MAG: class I SAM-dependent methyltransferase [Deltaproteobacteria bacterium]|nr:class I SAM-dependent methyltransferase [Deltaproteobacteria bacterium]